MLRNPAPGDWPMIRRDYSASSFSPLSRITAGNVSQLTLAWIWPMRDGGTNQPAPLVYRGTIYLNNPDGVVQAIRARDGSRHPAPAMSGGRRPLIAGRSAASLFRTPCANKTPSAAGEYWGIRRSPCYVTTDTVEVNVND